MQRPRKRRRNRPTVLALFAKIYISSTYNLIHCVHSNSTKIEMKSDQNIQLNYQASLHRHKSIVKIWNQTHENLNIDCWGSCFKGYENDQKQMNSNVEVREWDVRQEIWEPGWIETPRTQSTQEAPLVEAPTSLLVIGHNDWWKRKILTYTRMYLASTHLAVVWCARLSRVWSVTHPKNFFYRKFRCYEGNVHYNEGNVHCNWGKIPWIV